MNNRHQQQHHNPHTPSKMQHRSITLLLLMVSKLCFGEGDQAEGSGEFARFQGNTSLFVETDEVMVTAAPQFNKGISDDGTCGFLILCTAQFNTFANNCRGVTYYLLLAASLRLRLGLYFEYWVYSKLYLRCQGGQVPGLSCAQQ
jgi:hypothetical protein